MDARCIFLLITLINVNCTTGFTSNYVDVECEKDNTVFIEIVDVDSVVHYYHNRVYDTFNWCWLHNRYEDLERVTVVN